MDQRHREETTREEIDDLEQILPKTRLNERWPDDVTTIRTAAPAAALLLSRSPELPEGSPMICCMTEQQMRAFRQDLNLLRELGRVREW
jgi:hypothetical protein